MAQVDLSGEKELLSELFRVTKQVAALRRRERELRAELLSLVQPGDEIQADGRVVCQVVATVMRRFSATAFRAQEPALYETFRIEKQYIRLKWEPSGGKALQSESLVSSAESSSPGEGAPWLVAASAPTSSTETEDAWGEFSDENGAEDVTVLASGDVTDEDFFSDNLGDYLETVEEYGSAANADYEGWVGRDLNG